MKRETNGAPEARQILHFIGRISINVTFMATGRL
jgi:hypothetical protein